jgi:hypothetical protein
MINNNLQKSEGWNDRSLNPGFLRFAPYLLIILLLVTISSLTMAQTIVYGDTVNLGAGIAYTWVEVDPENIPLRIGISLSEAAVTNPDATYYSVNFPKVAVDSLFQHAYFNYGPQGHGPVQIYGVPHFDLHLYIISEAERLLIPGGPDNVPIPAEFIPENYIRLGDSVPAMGVHYVDETAPELHGEPFTRTLIYGFSEGRMVFIEPMITNEYFLTYPNDTLQIKQPQAYQRSGYYPMTYLITYDEDEQIFDIVYTDLVYRTGVVKVDEVASDALPETFALYQNYPNPFNPSTTIIFSIPEQSKVALIVYDILGRKVATLVDGQLSVGKYSTLFDASHLTSGVYIYQLRAGNHIETKRLILIK